MRAQSKHSKGKRLKKSNTGKRLKKIILVIIIIACLIALGVLLWKDKPEEPIIENSIENQIVEEELIEEQKVVQDEIVSVTDMPNTISGYTVIGKIVIEEIGISNYIVGKTTEESLKVAVTKFWGPSINTPGNFSITGHNQSHFFSKIHDLEVGDEFYLIGRDGRKVIYTIYDTFNTTPDDTSCIDQNEDGKREVTLITCNLGGVTRFIVKAREKN